MATAARRLAKADHFFRRARAATAVLACADAKSNDPWWFNIPVFRRRPGSGIPSRLRLTPERRYGRQAV